MTAAAVPALALASAVCSAGATILIRRGLRHYGPYTGFWINLVVGTACLWLAVALTGGFGRPSFAGIAFFALAGLIGTVAGRLLRFVSIETVGASITAALMNLSPLVSSALAILFLGERVGVAVVVGTLVIVGGTTLLSSGGRRIGVRPGRLVLPVGSAVCFGVVAVLRKVGLSDMAPVPGFAVNVTAALAAFSGFLVASRQTDAMACRGGSLVYFVVAGVAENLSVLLVVVALSVGHVSVVAPLASVSPIFVLVLSFFFLRGLEILTARIVVGTVLIVAGVYLITALAAA
ncbi:MAG TPA: DMT family transporter [Methylomirabilota bacterium]|nr:DMT family transporter [Methylomirabilota bacterium]